MSTTKPLSVSEWTSRAPARWPLGLERSLFVGCIFLSAFLLFLVQPIIAKRIMPWFGGTSAVWTTCLMFFQLVLLAGYAYSDWATRNLSPRVHALVHVALLVLAALTLPISPGDDLKPDPQTAPIAGVLVLLAATVGLPYFCLSTTGPLLQAWYVRLYPQGQVYRLFALSNLASLAALLTYPFSIEPASSSLQQAWWWSGGFLVFTVLCSACAWLSRDTGAAADASPAAAVAAVVAAGPTAAPPSRRQIAVWMMLSAMGSMLLLAVSNHITQNIAAVPFLWLLPLSLYLLTFVLCFEGRGWYRRSVFVGPLLVCVSMMAWEMNVLPRDIDLMVAVPVFAVGIFVCCMFFHGELSQRKPAPQYLTRFYLTLSLGGALGGVAVGALAPLVFDAYYELPILLVLTALLALRLLWGYLTANKAAFVLLVLALATCALTLFMGWVSLRLQTMDTLATMRNFYGASKVGETDLSSGDVVRTLHNGSIMHGMQITASERRLIPTTYYGKSSGVALALRHFGTATKRVGVVGLGVGTLAAYGRTGDAFRFYEINPQSRLIAERDFSYLKDSAADVSVVLGDARLMMEAELAQGRPGGFDMLVVDAFSGDSIPVHLITREAMHVYRRHLKPGGILAFHVSNLFLKLEPVVETLAREAGMQAVYVRNDKKGPETASAWVLVTSDAAFVNDPAVQQRSQPIESIAGLNPWTDAHNNLFTILK